MLKTLPPTEARALSYIEGKREMLCWCLSKIWWTITVPVDYWSEIVWSQSTYEAPNPVTPKSFGEVINKNILREWSESVETLLSNIHSPFLFTQHYNHLFEVRREAQPRCLHIVKTSGLKSMQLARQRSAKNASRIYNHCRSLFVCTGTHPSNQLYICALLYYSLTRTFESLDINFHFIRNVSNKILQKCYNKRFILSPN